MTTTVVIHGDVDQIAHLLVRAAHLDTAGLVVGFDPHAAAKLASVVRFADVRPVECSLSPESPLGQLHRGLVDRPAAPAPQASPSLAVPVARCPEHGIHGARDSCFVCGGPVEQVPMVPLRSTQVPG